MGTGVWGLAPGLLGADVPGRVGVIGRGGAMGVGASHGTGEGWSVGPGKATRLGAGATTLDGFPRPGRNGAKGTPTGTRVGLPTGAAIPAGALITTVWRSSASPGATRGRPVSLPTPGRPDGSGGPEMPQGLGFPYRKGSGGSSGRPILPPAGGRAGVPPAPIRFFQCSRDSASNFSIAAIHSGTSPIKPNPGTRLRPGFAGDTFRAGGRVPRTVISVIGVGARNACSAAGAGARGASGTKTL